MRIALLSLLIASYAAGETTADLWTQLQEKRSSLTFLHQEFEVSHVSRTSSSSQASKRKLTLDMRPGQWRERSASGSGVYIRIFDGESTVRMEEGGEEYTRKAMANLPPLPVPYNFSDPDWKKAKELKRGACGVPGVSTQCVLVDVPLRAWNRNETKMLHGVARFVLDTGTGMIVTLRTVEDIQTSRSSYQSETVYQLSLVSYNSPSDLSLFRLPAGLHEVKALSNWRAAQIRKQLGGKPAPELSVTSIEGQSLQLSSFKGKTVLLDFFTTWCPPCRKDGPAIDRLYKKYAAKDLMVIGISVSEDRPIVEKYLRESRYSFPVVLTSENEMPRPFQISDFPTYIVIDADGNLSAAVEGDQGFGELLKLLKKAGLEP